MSHGQMSMTSEPGYTSVSSVITTATSLSLMIWARNSTGSPGNGAPSTSLNSPSSLASLSLMIRISMSGGQVTSTTTTSLSLLSVLPGASFDAETVAWFSTCGQAASGTSTTMVMVAVSAPPGAPSLGARSPTSQ